MNSLLSAATLWFGRARQNPKTTVFGVAKMAGAIWYMYTHPESFSALQFMHPETLVPLGILASGIESLLSADAKDEMRARDVQGDTTLIGEK